MQSPLAELHNVTNVIILIQTCSFVLRNGSLETFQQKPSYRQICPYRPLWRGLDRCDRMIQNKCRDPNGGNVYTVTIQITCLTRKFRNVELNLHCDVLHIITVWVSSLTLDCNGVFAIKAYNANDKDVVIR